LLVFGALAGAAVVPLAKGGVNPWEWLKRAILRRLRPSVDAVVAEPPVIENDKGWKLIHSDNVDQFEDWLRVDFNGKPHGPVTEPSLGSHVLIELFDCEPASLKAEDTVGEAMLDAAKASEATIVTHDFHEFKPWGVSGAVIIQESHYTIHTWPEHKYAAVDLFYCGGTIHVDRAVEVLRERFKPGRIKFLVVRRGIESEVELS
jgi:S-adenosylmethionine decarboxylase